MSRETSHYRWWVLALVVTTNVFAIAAPSMAMSVLAKEISQDLRLSLVQVGLVWGVGSLPGILTGLLGGAIGDKIGSRPILIAGCLLAGLAGATRGLADSFASLLLVVLLLGAVSPILMMNGLKTCGQWFPSGQLGLANGVISMGMALGFLGGSFLSAEVLSPLLGGWRQVLIAYGLAAMALSIPWFFTRVRPGGETAGGRGKSIRESVLHVARSRDVVLLGLALFGIGGCVQGLLGYLPLYLRNEGWPPLRADGTLSAFHMVSMVFALPVALWSDRLRSRKRLLMVAGVMIASGAGLLSVAQGWLVWPAVLLAGCVRDAFMGIYMTMVIETDGIGPAYAGSATGLSTAISGVGSFLAPPLGNSLAVYAPGAPFALWSVLALLGIACLMMVRGRVNHRIKAAAVL